MIDTPGVYAAPRKPDIKAQTTCQAANPEIELLISARITLILVASVEKKSLLQH